AGESQPEVAAEGKPRVRRFARCHGGRRCGIHSRVGQASDEPVKPLRLAFIGAGGVLSHQMRHLKPVPHVSATAVADVSEGALAWAKEQFGIPNLFTDYRRMLKEAEVDAVSVCTPNGLHAEHSIAALEAGKHV